MLLWSCKVQLKDTWSAISFSFSSPEPTILLACGRRATISGMRRRCRLRETGGAEFGYFLCYFKMVAPRALDFRPLVKENEALETRLRLRETGWAEFGYFLRYFEMAAPRALVFRPLVKGNEALGTRLYPSWIVDACAITRQSWCCYGRRSYYMDWL